MAIDSAVNDHNQGIHLVLAIFDIVIGILCVAVLTILIVSYKKANSKRNGSFQFHDVDDEPDLQKNVGANSHSHYSHLSQEINVQSTGNSTFESKYVIVFCLFGIFCVLLACIFGAIWYSETYMDLQTEQQNAVFESLHEFLWNLGEIACYLLFVDRLYHVFANTSHQISDIQYYCFCGIIILYLICVIIFCIYEVNVVDAMFLTNEAFSWIYIFGIELIDFMIGFWLIYLFCSKLLHITVDINQSDSFFMEHLNNTSKKLLDMVTKYCILCFVAIASTQTVNVMQLLIFIFIIGDPSSTQKTILISVHRWLMSVDMVINVLCLFFTTRYSQSFYDKCCHLCHNSMKRCCDKLSTSAAVKRRTNNQLQMSLLDDEDSFQY